MLTPTQLQVQHKLLTVLYPASRLTPGRNLIADPPTGEHAVLTVRDFTSERPRMSMV